MNRIPITAMLLEVLLFGCSSGDNCSVDETYDPVIDPADFVAAIDNTWFPLTPGTRLVYQEGDETIEVVVTRDAKEILGVACTVVRDTVSVSGEVLEDTYDWFAQDRDGNVWYFGEDTKEYENGKVVSTEGSWEAGVDGAKPGYIMLADPKVGDTYRQEYYACEAEDMAEVVSLNEFVSVPYGDLDNCIKTRDYTPLEPEVNENKYYCPGVGVALEVDINTGDRTELIEVTTF